MPNIKAKYSKTNFITQGQGAPVVLIHGVAASLHGWDYLVPDLVSQGFQACALDLLGHGESHKPADPSAYHVEKLYVHLTDWMDTLEFASPPVLVGHSLGGSLALMYAMRRPDNLRGLVLVNPVVGPSQTSALIRWLQRKPEVGSRALQKTPKWLIEAILGWEPEGTRFTLSERKRQAADYKRAAPQIVSILPTLQDLSAYLPAISTKTLVIWGRKDRALKPRQFRRLAQLMPNAVAHKLPDCGHQPHIARPKVFNRLVIDFLKTL
jgi:pimeloyl-ACP methyl ester carboxylesterase